jgi:hypothetical protein
MSERFSKQIEMLETELPSRPIGVRVWQTQKGG